MVALETGILLARQEMVECEAVSDTETYVFLFNKNGDIFLTGNRKDGYDTIHGNVDPKTSVGEWIINELQNWGLSGEDLSGLSVFPETHKLKFQKRKIEVVGILCDPWIARRFENNRKEAGFIPVEILINRDYAHLTPSGLGELADRLADSGVIDRREIFVPEGN